MLAAADASTATTSQTQGGGRKVRQGIVVSNKMNKSVVVAVVRRVRHPLYKKYFNKTKKYMAHDETNDCNVGDTVRIVETRPLSASKHWRVDTIIDRAK
ncbi:MAG TPA: 30S ribosomal protein S17 [Candidatus Kapabacteria bacterium]|nr:30S ribosomal protein S17 [Candidatus Kapabacteria bacterium]